MKDLYKVLFRTSKFKNDEHIVLFCQKRCVRKSCEICGKLCVCLCVWVWVWVGGRVHVFGVCNSLVQHNSVLTELRLVECSVQ